MIHILFSLSLFASAVLLFVIQPMVAKMLLPVYGGTPAVWTVCMLFFQFLLLIAYGYAWVLSYFCGRHWRFVHAGVVAIALFFLPLTLIPTHAADAPDLGILRDLIGQLGLPLLMVAASAPLLQFAYSLSRGKQAHDPYFLYVASNIGSLSALLSYPWLIERWIGLKQQFVYWNYLFGGYCFLLAVILCLPYRQPALNGHHPSEPVAWQTKALWIGYSFIPCSLMLGVTFYISTDIASTPLFWVIPLALYLLSFVITFAQKPMISQDWLVRNSLLFIIFPVIGFIFGANLLSAWQLIAFHLACFMMFALLCHGELVRLRPAAHRLTSFYFCLALGGVLAGLFNGLLAPRLFNGAYEYPITFVFATLCIPLAVSRRFTWMPFALVFVLTANYFLSAYPWYAWIRANRVVEIGVLVAILLNGKEKINLFASLAVLFLFLFSPWFKLLPALDLQRNFYGVKQVTFMSGVYALLSQSTVHGFQSPGALSVSSGSMAYYAPVQPVLKALQAREPSLQTLLVGLGTGMLTCQFRPSDAVDIIDIDAQVIGIAKDTRYFTYLRDCPPRIFLSEGDGRRVLGQKADHQADLVIIDAFSSDAIPTHLLTREAFLLYQRKLHKEGVILVNISNRHLRLLPVLNGIGRALDLIVLHALYPGDAKAGKFPAEWVLLTANEPLARSLMDRDGWRFVTENESILWTDNYSNIVSLLKW
ncbi:spermidine synthase [Legionella taurinensis]|uniref:Spermidine synthase n=1 Tax=Legionella taurinensis TaxID=70611 RepID=A0A3A5L7P7_9GAMM|nr:fused MFS/spermidine synthase [Legionella taurinensis]MDX1836566.1 fused MFS/spermidine synthase [Legionella taurinensis]PUT42971.1 spermidine synthase [Legionella taurinensis]PUT45526.1 spermidine synthase [Legionella taurinensis]PUT46899.1 spermidine synthase [Legionella taurinensis]PUT49293.1 spermidine synthase [Legionella taurinensis]